MPVVPLLVLGLHAALAPLVPGHIPVKWVVMVAMGIGIAVATSLRESGRIADAARAGARGAIRGVTDVVVLIVASKCFIAALRSAVGPDVVASMVADAGVLELSGVVAMTYLFAVLSGSGDAIVMSVVQCVLPHVALSVPGAPAVVASMIWFAGEMGRCISPVAASTITVAEIADAAPGAVARGAVLPMTAAFLACECWFLHLLWMR